MHLTEHYNAFQQKAFIYSVMFSGFSCCLKVVLNRFCLLAA